MATVSYCKIACLLILTAIVVLECSSRVESSSGVCKYRRAQISYTRYERRYYTTRRSSTYRCGAFGLYRCTRYYLQYYYYTATRYGLSIRYYISYSCCPGYKGPVARSTNSSLFCDPVCTNGCNGGRCISPGNCTCTDGWTGSSCETDIDECNTNNGGCDQSCANNNGSYTCSCNQTGFTLAQDGRTCADINECTGTDGRYCQQICVNTHGSHHCDCHNGYKLSDNGRNCTDINECDTSRGGCEHNCTNTEGSFNCGCTSGHILNADKRSCSDINECATNDGGCHHACVNTVGSYYCQCQDGYKLSENRHSCIALPCPNLTPPTDGNMSCSGPQVTDQNCSFSCKTGYKLTGSALRICLPNQTWTGTPSSCDALHCSPPYSSDQFSVIYPCSNRYLGNCSLICHHGYQVSQATNNLQLRLLKWQQNCVLTSNTTVDWTGVETCEERDICRPNPCSPGQCSKRSDQIASCDCRGTYHIGKKCHIGYITSRSIPILRVGNTVAVQLSSNPLRTIRLLISSNGLNVSQNHSLQTNANTLQFPITPSKAGLFKISYSIISSYQYVRPDDSVVLVLPREQRRLTSNYFRRLGLENGHLGVGCCEKVYNVPPRVCVFNVSLHSSCSWNTEMQTNGVVFISIGSNLLPFSVAGYNLKRQSLHYSDETPSNDTCSSCTRSTASCYSLPVSLSPEITSELLEHNSLLYTFLNKTRRLYPSWLSLAVRGSDSSTPRFSLFDFSAFFGSWKQLNELVGCNDLSSPDPNQHVYAIRAATNLLFTVDSLPIILHPSTSEPFCMVFDACSAQSSALYAVIPPSLQPSRLSRVSSIASILSGNGQLVFYNITLKDGGIPYKLHTSYWNGSALFQPMTPNYKFNLHVSMFKSFRGGHLTVNMTFNGSVLHNTEITQGEVPGLLVGSGNFIIKTVINDMEIKFQILFGEDHPILFSFPGSSVTSVSSLLPGMAFPMSKFHTFCSPSSPLCVISNSSTCLSHSYLSLDGSLNAVKFSFTSDCLWLYLKDLKLTYGFNHTVTVFGNSDTTRSVTVLSHLKLPYLDLGSFFKLQSNLSSILLHFSPTSDVIDGAFYNVNVSIFDAQLLTNLSVLSNSYLSFEGYVTIFGYDMFVVGTSSLQYNTLSLPLSIEAVFLSHHRSNISRAINDLFQKEIYDLKLRQTHISNAINETGEWYDYIMQQASLKQTELSQAQEDLHQATVDYNSLLSDLDDDMDILTDALQNDTKINSTDDKCLQDMCGSVCVPGIQCSLCYSSFHLNVSYNCHRQTDQRGLHKVRYVPVRQWVFSELCHEYFKVSWYDLYYVTKESYCTTRQNLLSQYVLYQEIERNKVLYCNQSISSNRITSSNICCQCQDCEFSVPDFSCLLANKKCYEELLQEFSNSSISSYYQEFVSKANSLEESRRDMVQKQTRKNQTEFQYTMLQSLSDVAANSLQRNIQANQSLYEETQLFDPFISVTSMTQEMVKVNNLSFYVELNEVTPTTLRVLVEAELIHTKKNFTISVTVDFLNWREDITNELAAAVLEEMVNGNTNQSYQHVRDSCYKERPIKLYVGQLLDSLQSALAELNSTRNDVLQLVRELQNNTFVSLANNSLIFHQQQLLKLIEELSFPLWQIGMEELHVNVSKIEPFGCTSFTECLVAISTTTEYLLGNSNTYGNMLNELKKELPQISYNRSLSFQKANSLVQKLQMLLKTATFCRAPPTVSIIQTNAVNVIQNHAFGLSCTANSTIPVAFYWTKNNVLLPNSNSSSYMVKSAQLADNGHYQCIAFNDVGATISNSVLVTVYAIPTLSVVLPAVMNIYEGVEGGVDLICDTNALPSPSWKWFYSASGNSLHEITGANLNVYTIVKPTLSHQGWYQCLAYNVLTNATCEPLQLRVLPTAITRIQYTLTLNVNLRQNGDYQDNDISDSLLQYVQGQLDSSNNTLSNTGITRHNSPAASLSLYFQMTTPSISKSSLPVVSTQLNPAFQELQSDVQKLIGFFQEGHNLYFVIQNYLIPFTVNSFQVGPRTFVCPSGYKLHSNHLLCVACTPGHFSNDTFDTLLTGTVEELVPKCIPCPLGTHQGKHGQSNCTECSNGFSTRHTGSSSKSHCIEFCSPNTYSSTGFLPCNKCLPSQYQPHSGQTKCIRLHTNQISSSVFSTIQTVNLADLSTSSVKYTTSIITGGESNTTTAGGRKNIAVTIPVVLFALVIFLITVAVIAVAIVTVKRHKKSQGQTEETNMNPCYGPRPNLDMVLTNQFTQEDTIKKVFSVDSILSLGLPKERREIDLGDYPADDSEHIYETLSTYSKEDEDYI